MNKRILTLSLVLISAAAGVYFRFYPKLLPGLDIQARQDVYGAEKAALARGLDEKYPDFSAKAKDKLILQLFKERLKEPGGPLESEVRRHALQMKERFRDASGHVYLNGIDSYYWLRLLQNLLAKGHIGDRSIAGIEYDDLVGNPIDPATKRNIHIWLGFVFYKAAALFSRDVPLEEVLFYIPIFLSLVIAFFSFFTAKNLGCDDFGAFFASVAINLSPFLLSRSIGEWFDTDIYNVLLPLLVFGTFLAGFRTRTAGAKVFSACLAGLFLAFYASTWQGWWFVFDIMVFASLIFIVNKRSSATGGEDVAPVVREHAIQTGLFVAFATLFIILLNGFSVWKDLIAEPLRLSAVFKVTPAAVWPNVYLTVAELSPVRPEQVVALLGGNTIFITALLGLTYIFLADKGLRDDRSGFGLLVLFLWVIGTFYVALSAIRFVLLLVVPIGLAFGLAVTKIYRILEILGEKFSRYLRPRSLSFARSGATALFSVFLAMNLFNVHKRLLGSIPVMDDFWHQTLTKIRNETPPDAVINSWWDFGHWFKAVAQRRVLFDGMTQNTPYAYWMANALLTDDEGQAAAILRMVGSGGNKAADLLEKEAGFSSAKAVSVIKSALRLKKEDARQYLMGQVPAAKLRELMDLLFPGQASPAYLIVSYDMPGKIGPISYIGNWDFGKVDAWFKKKQLKRADFLDYFMKNYNITADEAEARYLEALFVDTEGAKLMFSTPMGFFSPPSACEKREGLFFCDNSLVASPDASFAYVASEFPERRGIPKSLVFFEAGKLKEELFKDADLKFGGLIFRINDKYKSLLLSPSLGKSMLVRLYFLKGEGLRSFKLWHEAVNEKGDAIYVYEVIY